MAKSTLDSLEKLLVKFITPIDQKFTIVMKELKKLEDKIDKLENKNQQTLNDAGRTTSPAVPVAKPVTNTHTGTGERQQRTREVKRLTHTSVTPTAVAATTPAAAPTPPSYTTVATEPCIVSQRGIAQAVTPLCRPPPPLQPTAPLNSRSHDNVGNDDEWHVVKHKTKRPPPRRRAVITGVGSTDDELMTVERVRKLHACFFKPETTPESIITYMNKKSPGTNYHADKIKLAHNYYSSFAITVPCSQFNFFMTAENWPPGTEISEWFRRSDGRAGSTSTNTREALRRSRRAPPQPRRPSAGAAQTSTGAQIQPL